MRIVSKLSWVLGSFAIVNMAVAGCLIRDMTEVPGTFKSYYFCKNTLSVPQYQFSSYLDAEQTFSLFSFDPRGVSIMCHEYDVGGQAEAKCNSWKSHAVIPRVYKGPNHTVTMIDLGTEPDRRVLARELESGSLAFATASSVEGARATGCFASVNPGKKEVLLGFDKKTLHEMPVCLTMLEGFFKKNKRQLMKLIKP